jgi:hypothetical protein
VRSTLPFLVTRKRLAAALYVFILYFLGTFHSSKFIYSYSYLPKFLEIRRAEWYSACRIDNPTYIMTQSFEK